MDRRAAGGVPDVRLYAVRAMRTPAFDRFRVGVAATMAL
jgi:hypothetical protein